MISFPSAASDTHWNAGTVVHLGVIPWTTPQLLKAWAEPLRARLERETGNTFALSSASDFKRYLLKAIEGKYTVAEMPMHMSLYLVKYHGFIPVSFGRAGLRTYIITLQGSGVNSLEDLHREPYLLPDPLAIVSLMTKEVLGNPPENHFKHSKNHWSVIKYVMEGRFAAGSVLSPMYDELDKSVRRQLKVLYKSSFDFDGIYVMPPQSSEKVRHKIGQILNGFTPTTNSIVYKIDPVKPEELAYWFTKMGKYADLIHEKIETAYPAHNLVN